MQVMFVDDEPRVLSGIERALMMTDEDWGCRFVHSGQEALAMLEDLPADVVVSDMRMPFMDGAELLRQVRERWPSTIRIILSGYSDADATLRMLDVAHQFVAKPCDSTALLGTVENAMRIRAMCTDPCVLDVVGRVSRLPAAPKVFTELCRMMADPDSNTHHIAELLGSDPALSAKILQLANSAYFARGNPVHDVGQAIARLGLNNVRLLVLASQVFADGQEGSLIETLQHRALLTCHLATEIALQMGAAKSPAPAAALLAQVGLTIPELRDNDVVGLTTACNTPLYVAVGAYLLAMWGLPMEIVNAVADHRNPGRCAVSDFDATGVVHVATSLAQGEAPDFAYLEKVGVADKWPEWQALLNNSVNENSDE